MTPQDARPWRDRLLIGAAGLLLFFLGLGNHDLWNPDEPRYAEVTREMRLSGDYLVPHLNGEIYSHKPPLLFWSMHLAAVVKGELDETAARLPSALAGLLTLLLVFEIGRRLFHRRIAWLAVAAFATCIKIPIQARTGQIDMLLTSLVALAVYFWVRGYTEKRPGFYPLFFAAAGVATLAKGPVGLLPPLFSILAFLFITRDRDERRRLKVGLGLLIWAAVVLAWLVPAAVSAGWPYIEQIVFKQNVTRYANPWHHHQPFYYYLPVILADFFPWSLLLPGALWAGWRETDPRIRRHFLFAVCWMVVTIVFFSLSPAKRTVYVLTMYPGMALALAVGLDRLAVLWPRERAWVVWPFGAVAVLLGVLAGLLPKLAAGRPEVEPLPADFPWWASVAIGWLALTAAATAVMGFRRGPRTAAAVLAAGAVVFSLGLTLVLLPPFDALKSARPHAERLLAELGPDEAYAIFPSIEAPFLFYTRRFADILESEEELHAYAARPGKVWVLAEPKALEKLERPPDLALAAPERGGFVLLTSP